MAAQRGYEIVNEYKDRLSGVKARRPGLDDLMRDARCFKFDVVLVWASDRIARSVGHFFDVLDGLDRLNIEFISFRENTDTGGPLGRAIVVIIAAIAELERNLLIERVRAGMRRAHLERRYIGRTPLALDRDATFAPPCTACSASKQLNGTLFQKELKNPLPNSLKSRPDLIDPAAPKRIDWGTVTASSSSVHSTPHMTHE